jgi:nicotinic acetylcholine receptor
MAPWVQRIFIEFLPRLLCIQRPKKEEEPQEEQPPEVLTDVFHVPPDVEKYSPFCTNKFSTDFDIPGEATYFKHINSLISCSRQRCRQVAGN